MNAEQTLTEGFQCYLKNKEMHFHEHHGLTKGGFMKKPPSSRNTKERTPVLRDAISERVTEEERTANSPKDPRITSPESKLKEKDSRASLNSEESNGLHSRWINSNPNDPNHLMKSQIRAHLEQNKDVIKKDSHKYSPSEYHSQSELTKPPKSSQRTRSTLQEKRLEAQQKTLENKKRITEKSLFPSKVGSPPKQASSNSKTSIERINTNNESNSNFSKHFTTDRFFQPQVQRPIFEGDQLKIKKASNPTIDKPKLSQRAKKIEDHLIDRAKAVELKKKITREQANQVVDQKPQISNYSKKIERKGNVHERLYNLKDKPKLGDHGDQIHQSKGLKSDRKQGLLTPANGSKGKSHSRPALNVQNSWRGPSALSQEKSRGQVQSAKSSDTRQNSKLVDNAAVEEFFQRNIAWLHKKNDKMVREREEKLGQELVDCTFKPVTHQFVKDETPGLDHGIDQETDYRMVFDGKTYDLAKEKELQEFLLKSIAKSGQRSIFRKSNETSNKIYQEIMR